MDEVVNRSGSSGTKLLRDYSGGPDDAQRYKLQASITAHRYARWRLDRLEARFKNRLKRRVICARWNDVKLPRKCRFHAAENSYNEGPLTRALAAAASKSQPSRVRPRATLNLFDK